MAYSPGQRLLLRNGKFAQFVRPVLRLGGEIIEVVLADGPPRLVNARDVLVTDWSGVERRVSQRRRGERRRFKLPFGWRIERRTHGERRKQDRRQFALPKKFRWSPRIP
jgi:hypothetical protein